VEQTAPQTAAMMRTATWPRKGSTAAKPKPVEQPPQPQQYSNTQYGSGRSGIIHVPPLSDYGLDDAYEPVINEQSDFAEPVDESQQQEEQQQVDKAAQQQEYVNYSIYLIYLSSCRYY